MKPFLASRQFVIAAVMATSVLALGIGQRALESSANAQGATVQSPVFEVDPLWPKPLPNNWLLSWSIGLWVDDKDNVWMIHRNNTGMNNNERGNDLKPPIAECCNVAPPILVFNPEGDLIRSWGGPGQGFEWPQSNHGIHIDYKGNVWIGANGEKDSHILKFTQDGKFLMQVGKMDKIGRAHV